MKSYQRLTKTYVFNQCVEFVVVRKLTPKTNEKRAQNPAPNYNTIHIDAKFTPQHKNQSIIATNKTTQTTFQKPPKHKTTTNLLNTYETVFR